MAKTRIFLEQIKNSSVPGSIIIFNSGNTAQYLVPGSQGEVLTIGLSGLPEYTSITGGTGITGEFLTGATFNSSTLIFTNTTNSGNTIVNDLSSLASDRVITGGTYDENTGTITYITNSGNTFDVTGITFDNTFITGGTFIESASTITFDNSVGNSFDVTGLTTNLLEPINNPLDSYFGSRLTPISQDDGFYINSPNNKATGVLVNNTSSGDVAIAGFRATVSSDPFGAGAFLGILGPNYYAPWLRNHALITGENLNILVNDNTGSIVFSLGNTNSNQLTEAQQDKVLTLNPDRSILAPSLTNAIISGSTDDSLITKGYLETFTSGFTTGGTPSLEGYTYSGTRAGGDLIVTIGDYDNSNTSFKGIFDAGNGDFEFGDPDGTDIGFTSSSLGTQEAFRVGLKSGPTTWDDYIQINSETLSWVSSQSTFSTVLKINPASQNNNLIMPDNSGILPVSVNGITADTAGNIEIPISGGTRMIDSIASAAGGETGMTLSQEPVSSLSEDLFVNGIRSTEYTRSGTSVTFNGTITPLVSGDSIDFIYNIIPSPGSVVLPSATLGDKLYYDGSDWVEVTSVRGSTTGTTGTTFVLPSVPATGTLVDVYLNGLYQSEGVSEDFSISADTITFTSSLISSDKIIYKYETT